MPRAYIGVKLHTVKMEPHKIEKMKRLAKLRGCSQGQVHRDLVGEGLERLAPCLNQPLPS